MSRVGTTCLLPVPDASNEATTVVPKASLAMTINASILSEENFLTQVQKEICTALYITNCTITVDSLRVVERRLLLSHTGWNVSENLTTDSGTQRKTPAERSTAQASSNDSLAQWDHRRSLSQATSQILFDISIDTDDTDEAAIEFFTQIVLVEIQSQLMNSSSPLMNSPLGQHLDVAGSTLSPCFACPVGKIITDAK